MRQRRMGRTTMACADWPARLVRGRGWAGFMLALSLVSAPAGLVAQASAVQYAFDPSRSIIHVVTHRSGLLSFLGHDHAILATEWTGTLCWWAEQPPGGRAHIAVAASGLVIDSEEARSVAGLGRGPSPEQVRQLQAKLLNGDHLAAVEHPYITLVVDRVLEVVGERMEVQGRLRVRDRIRELRFPLIFVTGDEVRVRGTVRVQLADFGIRRESIAGVVRVANPVDIHFDLVGARTGAACS